MRSDDEQDNQPQLEGQMIETRLEELLSKRGRTMYWLAKEVGTTYNTIHKLARGKADSIKFPILNRICKVLGCQPGDVLVYVEDEIEQRQASKRQAATKTSRPGSRTSAPATVRPVLL